MKITIEKNVPLRRSMNRSGASIYKFEEMEHGDSFLIEDEPLSGGRLSAKIRKQKLNAQRNVTRNRIWSAFKYWKGVADCDAHLVSRHVTEGAKEGLRVWFITD
tara:strand:- start:7979 stop:8290 length:312 start_codon:yes stop_codon:yes gene_type:complete